ncbi:MAG TPA: DUF3108 domain-containing protein [Pseudorhizobium sp.]|nr:DUF3108 domain-containing protein [Pseudorhizobium sp.]
MVARRRSFLVTAFALLLLAGPADTAGTRHISEYDISLGILPIAKASFASEFGGNDYEISGSFRSWGLAELISKISASTSVSGRKHGDRLQAERYNLVYKTGKRTRTYDVTYRNGNVTQSVMKPEPKRRPDNWVPVTDSDLRSVLDPLSGLIFPGDAKVCPSRLPIYDGESRMDLVLSPKGTKPFSTEGFEGEAIVCEIRYVPKSGFRRGRSDIEYLKKTPMEIWFAKAQSVNVYAPVYARIPTRMGDVYVKAAKYGG